MNFTDREKELLLSNAAVYSRITLYDDDGTVLHVFNENDYLVNWEYEDYRYVPDQGFIGQFVERLLDGVLMNIPTEISLVDKEIEMEIAVKDDELEEQVYHSFGRFIITECAEEDTSGNYKFKSSDYVKKFNATFDRDMTVYPCLAIDLLNDVCQVADVDMDSDDYCFVYAVPETGLSAGNYCFSTYVGDTLTYMNFSTDTDLNYNDSLMLVVSKNAVIQRTVDSDYKVTEKEIPYTSSETQVGDLLSSDALYYIDFVNNNFVIDGNQFDEGVTCREVVRCIAKLSYTWARVGVDNKLHLDFVKKSESDIDEYDEIDTDKYYEAKVTGDVVSPINKVLIGMSQVEGENIYCSRETDLITLDKLKGETSQDTYTGKNLFDWENESQKLTGVNINIDQRKLVGDNTCIVAYCECEPNTTYTISRRTPMANRFVVATSTDTPAQNIDLLTTRGFFDNTTTSYTITTGSTAHYIIIRFIYNNDDNYETYAKTIQVEQGSTATTYEQYVGGEPSPNPDYPQPVKTVSGYNNVKITGKNLLNNTKISETINGVTFTRNDDGTVTANGTATATTQYYIKDNDNILRKDILNKSIILSGCPNGGSSTTYRMQLYNSNGSGSVVYDYGDGSSAFTFTNTGYYNLIIQINNGVTVNNLVFKPMIRLSSVTDNTYEEYQSQEFEIDLGKNLFDKNNVNVLNASLNGQPVSPSNNAKTLWIKIIGGKTYTISKVQSSRFRLCTTEVQPELLTPIAQYTQNDNATSMTITTNVSANYLLVYYYLNGTDTLTEQEILDSIQIEEGSIATEYAPYFTVCKNLFDKDNVLVGYNIINTDGSAIEQDGRNTLNYTQIKSNTTYTVSGLTIRNTAFYDEDKTFISAVANETTFTTPENAKYLRFGYVSTSSWVSAQLEEGSFPTRYEPYYHGMELYKLGDVQDYIAKGSGKNLIKLVDGDYSNNDLTIKVIDGVLYVNGTPSAAAGAYIPLVESVKIPANETYTFRANLIGGSVQSAGQIAVRLLTDINGSTFVDWKTLNVAATGSVETPTVYKYVLFRINANYSTTNAQVGYQLEKGDTATYFEPYDRDCWYKYKLIHKEILDSSSLWNITYIGNNSDANYSQFNCTKTGWLSGNMSLRKTAKCNYFSFYDGATASRKTQSGFQVYSNSNPSVVVSFPTPKLTSGSEVASFKTWLDSHKTYIYYVISTPIPEKITYQPLIDQLNAIKDIPSYDGNMYITSTGVDINAPLDINVMDLNKDITTYSGSDITFIGHEYPESAIKIYDNSLTHSEELRRIAINGADKLYGITYTPMTINSIGHPWLNGDSYVKLTNLESNNLYFYPFDRKIIYQGYLVTDLSSTAENKVQEKYENKDTIVYRLTHTEIDVDKANQRIDLLAQKTEDNTTTISDIQIDVGDIKSTVSTIENTEIPGVVSRLSSVEQTTNTIASMFQITGGINILRNSAFLLKDDVWEFTDNGTNPYHTELGNSYDATLSGTTVSVAEIKFRATKIKSKPENITHLKTDGTKYTFNFYHKQDNNMTTTIKMYSTANPSIKAFDDIVITGQKPMTNYEISFIPAYTDYTIEIVSDSTASVGYSYIYDMMLNSGDKQSWQPASDEIYSTTLTMSRLGLQVYSVGDGTITLLGSDGLLSYETSDGKTLGRLVSKRTVDGDTTKTVTTQGVYLVSDINSQSDTSRWVETVINISGNKYKVEYMESGE